MSSKEEIFINNITLEETLNYLPIRDRETHKGQLGHVLIVGGDYGMGGAVRLAGEAALRTGAGRVSIATRVEHAFSILGACSELMCHGIQLPLKQSPYHFGTTEQPTLEQSSTEHSPLEQPEQSVSEQSSILKILKLLGQATVIVLGPGLGQAAWGQALFDLVLEHNLSNLASGISMVVDADALNILAQKKIKKDNWILTPHPGEAARLLKTTPQEIQKNRLASIHALQDQFGGTIVLKGADSLILGQKGIPSICHLGNPGMATAGMGDVLSGVIGALVAQGLTNEEAAKLGVCLHASAGDKVALYGGERGMKASDLFSMIQICLNPSP